MRQATKPEMALDDITVIDCCWLLPGQFTAMMLGDLGARVIHIERPGGDYARDMGAHSYATVNRGKESLTLDLKTPGGQAVLHRLIAQTDIVLEGFRPGVMSRLCADYATLSAIQPGLIYCSLSGFGQKDSPHRDEPGHGLNYAAIAGLQHVAGASISVGPTIGDLSGTMFAMIAVLAALRYRDRTGVGQHIDLSITDAVYGLMTDMLAGGRHGGGGGGSARATFGVFEAADGKRLTIGAVEDHFFAALSRAIGHPEWETDPRYAKAAERRVNEGELLPVVVDAIKTRNRDAWIAIFTKAGVPCAPLNDLSEAVHDVHAQNRDLVTWVDQPGVGQVSQIRFPVAFPSMETRRGELAPEVGEHTDLILAELGYSPSDIEDLHRSKAV